MELHAAKRHLKVVELLFQSVDPHLKPAVELIRHGLAVHVAHHVRLLHHRHAEHLLLACHQGVECCAPDAGRHSGLSHARSRCDWLLLRRGRLVHLRWHLLGHGRCSRWWASTLRPSARFGGRLGLGDEQPGATHRREHPRLVGPSSDLHPHIVVTGHGWRSHDDVILLDRPDHLARHRWLASDTEHGVRRQLRVEHIPDQGHVGEHLLWLLGGGGRWRGVGGRGSRRLERHRLCRGRSMHVGTNTSVAERLDCVKDNLANLVGPDPGHPGGSRPEDLLELVRTARRLVHHVVEIGDLLHGPVGVVRPGQGLCHGRVEFALFEDRKSWMVGQDALVHCLVERQNLACILL
mmetsp:Transcript_33761/g.88722  ORF Transcript_33761/g.88722 Transcript_33761/m.88722 type:complete len:350 (-) Transcript_33761:118-1167(-)